MPAARSPAQIEASRRNGARSRGPVTPEGKARSSRNALTHGLTAMQHLVLEDEAPDELDALIETITGEVEAASEIEARLARRLAIAFWKGERAERMEVALLDAAPRTRMDGYRQEEADPLTTFDVRRFNAIRGHQAAQGREISRCLKELRALRKEALTAAEQPEAVSKNEPKDPDPANDDARAERAAEPRSGEPTSSNGPPAPEHLGTVGGVPLLDMWGRPRLPFLGAARLVDEPEAGRSPAGAVAPAARSAQAQEAQDRQDHDHHADQPEDVVHGSPLPASSRRSSQRPAAAEVPSAGSLAPSWAL